MSGMVQVAVAGDVAEAEEMQEILRNAGIDSSVEQSPEEDAVTVLVPEAELETAQDAIEALTDPDDLISEYPGEELRSSPGVEGTAPTGERGLPLAPCSRALAFGKRGFGCSVPSRASMPAACTPAARGGVTGLRRRLGVGEGCETLRPRCGSGRES